MWKPASAYVFSSVVILPTSASPVVRPRARAVLVCAKVWTLAVTQRVFRPVSLGSGSLAPLALMGRKTALGSAIVRGCGMRRVSPRAMGYSPLASPASAHGTQWMAAVAPRSPGVMPTKSCRVAVGASPRGTSALDSHLAMESASSFHGWPVCAGTWA